MILCTLPRTNSVLAWLLGGVRRRWPPDPDPDPPPPDPADDTLESKAENFLLPEIKNERKKWKVK